jgi:uncharacterized membrane protein
MPEISSNIPPHSPFGFGGSPEDPWIFPQGLYRDWNGSQTPVMVKPSVTQTIAISPTIEGRCADGHDQAGQYLLNLVHRIQRGRLEENQKGQAVVSILTLAPSLIPQTQVVAAAVSGIGAGLAGLELLDIHLDFSNTENPTLESLNEMYRAGLTASQISVNHLDVSFIYDQRGNYSFLAMPSPSTINSLEYFEERY